MTTDKALAGPGSIDVGNILGAGWSQASGAITSGLASLDSWWSLGGITKHSTVTTVYAGGGFSSGSVTAYSASLAGYTGHVIWSVHGFPDSGGTYDQLLAGNFDSGFTAMFTAIAAVTPNATIRWAWESQGNWFNSGQGYPGSGYTDAKFAAAWDRVWGIGNGICPTFTWEWNTGLFGSYSPINVPMNPAHYDIIATDEYTSRGSAAVSNTQAWTSTQLPNYELVATIAARDKKAIGFSEVATWYRSDGTGCGDDDYWMTQFPAWIKQHDVRYFAYFNDNDPTGGSPGTVTNRCMLALPTTYYSAGPFHTDTTFFPKSAPIWQGSLWTPSNLAFTPATTTVAPPLQARRKRTTRMPFA